MTNPGDERRLDDGTSPTDVEGQRLFASVHGRLFGGGDGVVVGRYVLERRLGAGAMGEVFLARDRILDRAVALKLIHVHLARGRQAERLKREAKALARLAHPNVVHVYEVDQHQDRVFLAMEYVRGCSLREWIAERHPTWSEIRDAYVDAGRGLAAAHEVGLVHRDFKPDNVMRWHDGRICVADFGLASVGDLSPFERTVSEHETATSAPALTEPHLSRTGELKGTPAYMPPEQFGDRPVDARADQFAFCVALYEGLWGRRPFDESSLDVRRLAATRGSPEPPERGEVPTWIWPVLARGLSQRPEDRWPHMRALLAELAAADAQRSRRRRRLALGLALGLTAAGGSLAGASLRSEEVPVETCADEPEGLVTTWNDAARQAVRRAFAATQVPWAADAARRVSVAVDAWRAEWEQTRVRSCVERRAGGDPLRIGGQSACLEQRRSELAALLELFVRADAALVERALAATEELGDPRGCIDHALAPAPAQRDKVDELGRALDVVEATVRAARYADAAQALTALEDRVEETGHDPLRARLLELRGRALLWSSDRDGGVAALERAADLAEGSGDDRELAQSWRYLALWALAEARDEARAAPWLRRAEASARRLGIDPRRSGELATLRGHQRLLLHEFAAAEQEFRVAIADFEVRGQTIRLLEARRALAATLVQHGELAAALEPLALALAEADRALGSHHPIYAAIAHDLGATFLGLGRADEAQVHLRTAVAVWTASPVQRPELATAHISLAGIELAAARHPEAALELDRAAAILAATRPERHPDHGDLASARAALAFARGDFSAAHRELERAIEIYGAAFGPDDPYLAKVTAERGWVALAQRRNAAAERDFAAADAVLRGRGDLAGFRQSSLRGLALVSGARGDDDAALAWLQQVRVEACSPDEAANYHLWRAVLHWRLGDAEQARTHLVPGRAAVAEAERAGELAAMSVTPTELTAIESSARTRP